MSDSLFLRSVDRRAVLRSSILGALGLAAAPALAACGGGAASGGSGGGGSVSWAAWANPGEDERYKQFATELGKKIDAKVSFQAVVGDYQAKLLSQLAGGSAPDAFYVGDADMAKMIEAKQISDLTEYLDGGKSPVKLEDFPEDLYQWCKPADGSPGIFGIPVDCNPSVIWFNKDVLAAAGVSQDPSRLFEAGSWTPDALEDLLGKVRASGKKGLILANWWFNWCWAATMLGGQLTDESGKLVFADDPKAQEGLAWLLEQFKSGNITYAGSLPKGQSGDALFLAGQLALNNVGRWALPTLKDVKFGYDIAPVPSPSGKDIVPVPVATAAIALNAKAKNREKALELIGNYVSREGQKFRLSGGGNAVPSIKGLDEVATEGGVPAHGQWFNDVVAKGYAIPRAFVGNPKTATELPLLVDKLFKDSSTTAASFSAAVTRLVESPK